MLKIAVVIVVAVALYATGLAYCPPSLHHDEVFFALQAHAIASTGHDLKGRFLPLYVQMSDDTWFQPLLVYLTALVFKIAPLAETTIRLPSVLMGLADIVLVYFVAKRVFDRERPAMLAAVLLALTPAHFINSRLAMDYIYPVPFVLAWLLCLLLYLERRRLWLLFAATSFLGIGFYSYIASVVMMPLYLALTWFAIWKRHRGSLRPCFIATAGFLWPLVPIVAWAFRHRNALADTAARYELSKLADLIHPGVARITLGASQVTSALASDSLATILHQVRQATHFSGLTGRVSLYWYFFDPSYLFITGGYANVLNSTRYVGVFLLPLLFLVPLGLIAIATAKRSRTNALLILGFVSAPLAACLVVPEPYAIDRELELLPFGVLLAVFGVEYLMTNRRRMWRMAGLTLLAIVPLHFAFFYISYFTSYRGTSAFSFEGNRRGALEEIIGRDAVRQAPAVYLSSDLPFIDWYWKLYLAKHRREELLSRTVFFELQKLDVKSIPPGSLILAPQTLVRTDALVAAGELRRLAFIPEPADPPAFEILVR